MFFFPWVQREAMSFVQFFALIYYTIYKFISKVNWRGRVGPVVARSTKYLEVLVRILHWPNVTFSWHKKWTSEAPPDQGVNWYLERAGLCKFDIPGCRMLAAHKTGSEIVSPGRPERLFPNIAQWRGEVMSKGGWTAEYLKVALPKLVTF